MKIVHQVLAYYSDWPWFTLTSQTQSSATRLTTAARSHIKYAHIIIRCPPMRSTLTKSTPTYSTPAKSTTTTTPRQKGAGSWGVPDKRISKPFQHFQNGECSLAE